MNYCISKALRWWEKGLQSNMKEIQSAMDLMNSLLNAGNNLVVVDFFSPGCGGCKALHPKVLHVGNILISIWSPGCGGSYVSFVFFFILQICQLAEQNPEIQFLQVNYEQHKSMCYSLNVHVLPFFRFYRGAQGRVCSFSCTNATVSCFYLFQHLLCVSCWKYCGSFPIKPFSK